MTQSSAQAYEGTYSAAVQYADLTHSHGMAFNLGPAVNPYSAQPFPMVTIHAGRTYTLSGYYMTHDNSSTGTVGIAFNAVSPHLFNGTNNSVILNPASSWTYFTIQGIAPATTSGNSNYVWLGMGVTTTTQIFYFDNVRLTDGAVPLVSAQPTLYSGFSPRTTGTVGAISFMGDSLTVGYYGGFWTPNITKPVAPPGPAMNIYNDAQGGDGTAQMVGAAYNLVDPQFSPEAPLNITIIWGGTNDLGTLTALQIEANLAQYCRERHRIGWKCLIATLQSSANGDAARDAVNALLYADWWIYADGLVDLAANANIGADGAYTNATYFAPDGVHMTAAGYAIVTSIMQFAIDYQWGHGGDFALVAPTIIVGTAGGSQGEIGYDPPSKNIHLTWDSVNDQGLIEANDWSSGPVPIGLNRDGGSVGVGLGSGRKASVYPLMLQLGNGFCMSFDNGTTYDAGICRDSAGTIDVGNGLPGDKSGTLNLNNLNLSGTCVGCTQQQSLPSGTGIPQTIANPTPAYVQGASGHGTSLTIPSTVAGDSVFVVYIGNTQPSSMMIGSQSASKAGTCSPNLGGTACLWYVPNVNSGATTITKTGGTAGDIIEYEFSGVALSSPLDIQNTCTGSTTCAVSTGVLSQAQEAVIASFVCTAPPSSITGTNATFTNYIGPIFYYDSATAVASVTATTSVTATVNSACGNGTAGTAVGAIWSFKGAAQLWGTTLPIGAGGVPEVSATAPTVGAGVCWKTATTLGTCTAGTWPNCTTCN
jgi:lysophospholipase L1-like esterase